ncbi:MAG: hypothetical protein IPM98_13740 [Lewinellaceae bacterium]|nr:hypothetical protein [Lewinellaceae bacterium]
MPDIAVISVSSGVATIPTMSERGLILFALIIFSFSVGIRHETTTNIGMGNAGGKHGSTIFFSCCWVKHFISKYCPWYIWYLVAFATAMASVVTFDQRRTSPAAVCRRPDCLFGAIRQQSTSDQ